MLRLVRRVPAVREKIENEIERLREEFEQEMVRRSAGIPYVTRLPAEGIDREEILRLVERSVHLGKDGLLTRARAIMPARRCEFGGLFGPIIR